MLDVRLGSARGIPAVLAIPVPARSEATALEATAPEVTAPTTPEATKPESTKRAASGGTPTAGQTARIAANAATGPAGAGKTAGLTGAGKATDSDEAGQAADRGEGRTAASHASVPSAESGPSHASVPSAESGPSHPSAAAFGDNGPTDALELLPAADRDEAAAFLDDVEHKGKAGKVHELPRPTRRPQRWLFAGVGDGGEAGWRSAGAALARKASKEPALSILLPGGIRPDQVAALAEGLWLASYRYRLGTDDADSAPKLRRVTLISPDAPVKGAADASAGGAGAGAGRPAFEAALAKARVVVEATALARDLTNTPSARKTPAWMGRQIQKAASGITNLSVSVREPAALATEGFNGILAVGSGSANPPRLVELSWRPRGARRHVVLIGKGITFDTGGVCIKTRPGMKLMRKDMGGAAAVLAATLAAGTLRLPIRITALAPLAENSLGADSYRPGDVIRHYGGQTSEITNTDAEGRVVLADAIAYAVRRLRPDLIVDMATLTGAQGVALGKRTAAIFSDSDALAKDLQDAGEAIGESIWRMPLPDDYLEALSSDVADRVNATDIGAGAVLAALYLREFTGSMRDSWAHIDMSSPAWSETNDGETVKGATGWGVRTLLRWLESVAA
jgi:leucyl aminopeptidase